MDCIRCGKQTPGPGIFYCSGRCEHGSYQYTIGNDRFVIFTKEPLDDDELAVLDSNADMVIPLMKKSGAKTYSLEEL